MSNLIAGAAKAREDL